jgi:hypothetical protein
MALALDQHHELPSLIRLRTEVQLYGYWTNVTAYSHNEIKHTIIYSASIRKDAILLNHVFTYFNFLCDRFGLSSLKH